MYSPKLILGVELEIELPNDDDVSKADMLHVGPQYTSLVGGIPWTRHWKIVKDVEVETKGKIKVGTDGSLRDGLELRGDPLSLKDNKKIWNTVFELERFKQFASPEPLPDGTTVGMHVHMSGDPITAIILGKMMFFINDPRNAQLIELIAGRYNVSYAKIEKVTPHDVARLWHSKDCKSLKYKRIDVNSTQEYSKTTGQWCCSKRANSYRAPRAAFNLTPRKGSGDCEIRMFKSTVDKARFFANIEFCAALVDFCCQHTPQQLTQDNFANWLKKDIANRVKYPDLFRFLRDAAWVNGLIPKRSTFKEYMLNNRVFVPAKPLVV